MKTAAVIAEYNPLHAGHRYHLEGTKRRTGADCLLVILSGDFVQRGEPAVFDKFTRTRLALAAGADVVVELPVFAACGSAEYFAEGGVRLADALGADYLSFGCETEDLALLEGAATVLADEPEPFREALKKALAEGLPFAAARERAVKAALSEETASGDRDTLHTVLSSPNAALALEYLKALRRLGARPEPVVLARRGDSYHDPLFSGRGFPSATALREAMRDGAAYETLPGVPAEAARDLPGCRCPLFADDLTTALHHAPADAADIWDMPESVARRLADRREPFGTWSELCLRCKTKDLAYTRVSRALLHRVLGLSAADAEGFRSPDALYGRLLGLRRGSALPALLKEKSRIPLVTKLSDGEAALAGTKAGTYLAKDLAAHERYRTIVWEKYGVTLPEEHQAGIVVV